MSERSRRRSVRKKPGVATALAGFLADSRRHVKFLDAYAQPMMLGSLIRVTLRNGQGKACFLDEGVFACDSTHIYAGATVLVTLQGDVYHEDLVVQFDRDKRVLFVKSKLTTAELVDQINHLAAATMGGSRARP
jgi:hypothetical protein